MSDVLQDPGRIAIAIALKAMPMHLAWGNGKPAWDTDPEAEPTDATALVAEVGRRKVTSVEYVVPDAVGDITVPSRIDPNKVERFSVSTVPSRWLFVHTVFDFGDATGQTIREIALFFGGATDPALPPGQSYFTPAQVTDQGRMYSLDRSERVVRTGTTYYAYDFVLPV